MVMLPGSVVCVPALSVTATVKVNVPWTEGADAVGAREACCDHGERPRCRRRQCTSWRRGRRPVASGNRLGYGEYEQEQTGYCYDGCEHVLHHNPPVRGMISRTDVCLTAAV